ncbi:MAG: helix-turn-helix domain-containing protein [Gemmataceae bacterium]|nr:helix-turn-helix domain-containing protein [Gemmataceae bacterium]MCI0741059.1 helix-turn-helix domain-containing protein [Gemmataceae bacterium]
MSSVIANPPKTCLSVREAARFVRVSAGKVLAWIRGGDLKASDVGRPGRPQFRIRPGDLDDFLAGRSAAKPKAKPRRRRARPPGWVDFY